MASFGEMGDRRYVVVAMVEHGLHGGSGAGPVCKAVYDFVFKRNKRQETDRADKPKPERPVPAALAPRDEVNASGPEE